MNEIEKKKALIIGAGPAGLTAALEFLEKTDILPIVLESDHMVGGLSRTVNYKGNRIDIGGHRFFSKSDLVMNMWKHILPVQTAPAKDDIILGRTPATQEATVGLVQDPETTDRVMLIRQRVSRIFFLRKFFNYPVSLETATIRNLGILRMMKIGFSYIRARLFSIRREISLEDFFVNRFGKELYLTFFKDYTEKVWGVACRDIPAEWGAQRVKGLSITKAIAHALRSQLKKKSDMGQKDTETSLIEQFMYPKYGPGQLWEEVAELIRAKGGEIRFNQEVVAVNYENNRVTGVETVDRKTSEKATIVGDYILSTMPVKDLIRGFGGRVSPEIARIAEGLPYRDFITVGLLLDSMKIKNETAIPTVNGIVPDNWIYIQERDVKVGRLQIFNNWSPYMVENSDHVWIGLEYFCNEGDELWMKADAEFIRFAVGELEKIGIVEASAVIDAAVIRMPKAYPAYFGTYKQFDKVRNFTDGFENLFLIGRNGMHRYNNMDHSMLTAMTAVELIKEGKSEKKPIWDVNTEQEYHEESGEKKP